MWFRFFYFVVVLVIVCRCNTGDTHFSTLAEILLFYRFQVMAHSGRYGLKLTSLTEFSPDLPQLVDVLSDYRYLPFGNIYPNSFNRPADLLQMSKPELVDLG